MVRVRFAPSPTGPLHMGGVRTALYNYLFAKKNEGTFILRIEDTDQTRYVEGAEKYIQEALEWCGFEADESPWKPGKFGPYRQSERKEIYKTYAQQLIANDKAYYAFDTADELDEMRNKAKAAKMPNWQYNGITRNQMRNSLTLSEDEVSSLLENETPFVIRLKVPRNEEIRFHDEIRGWVVVNSSNVDDKVLYKSDGMPTYHLANIVDDRLMEITHVIRGEEWLPSAPLHVLLYQAFDWEAPTFAHLPLILRPDGNGKLSKRDGDRLGFPVFPLNYTDAKTGEESSGYKERGYFPEAFVNMLSFLGWNPGTSQEIFSLNELINSFSLERVGKAGAKFDAEKTKWFNQQYLRMQDNESLAQLVRSDAQKLNPNVTIENLSEICGLMKERAYFPKDILTDGLYFFQPPSSYDEKTVTKKWKAETPAYIKDIKDRFAKTDFSSSSLEHEFKTYLEEKELGFGKVGPGLRLCVTGLGMGPSLFHICEILGREETFNRIDTAISQLP